MNGFRRLIQEIHRRSLWQVLGIYLLGSWIALQVVDVLRENFGLPDWFPPFALALLVIGLPIVLATAFVQEGVASRQPSPTTRDRNVDSAALAARATRHKLLTWRNAILGGVLAFALWGVVAAGWLLLGRGATGAAGSGSELRSIAVLPFKSIHTDEESRAFTSGIHEDLLTQLTKIEGLTVISRTSVLKYRETEKSLPEIAGELGVATVLEGGVQRSGERVRLNVQLIEASADRHLWAETYDERLTTANIFAIQSDLARQIAGALRATLTPAVEQRLEVRPTESLEAYDLYTRGRYVESSRGSTREGLETAAGLFRQALVADPGFAPAHAGLADAFYRLWNLGYLHESEALPVVRESSERALELDPNLAEAYAMRGVLLRVEQRRAEAEDELRHAIELNPGSAIAHSRYSALLLELGRAEEALTEARRAVELDPLSAGARRSLVSRLAWAGESDEAIAESRKLLELEPGDADAYYYAAMAHSLKGEHQPAIEAFHQAIQMNPADPYYPAGLAWAYALAGERDHAIRYLEQAEEVGVPLKEVAIVYGALGEFDRAFEYLERAYKTEPGTLAGMTADPSADALRADPRWEALMERLGG